MKILILSDTHGHISGISNIIQNEKPDYIMHLGDHDRDTAVIERDFPRIPVASVKGNCDPRSSGPDKREFTLGGKRFLITHGHMFGVKGGLSSLMAYASKTGAEIVLFGHTHIPRAGESGGIICINPGSYGFDGTYAVLKLEDGLEPEYEIKEYAARWN